jgi:hypothetical protein
MGSGGAAVIIVLLLVGCGGSGGAGGRGTVSAGRASRSTGLPLPLAASGRFDMGIATAAMPAGWALIDTSDTRYDRQQSIEHGGGLDGFAILPRGADPNNSDDDLPLLSIGGGTGGTGGPPGQTLAQEKQTGATSMAALKPDGFSNFGFLDDTTVGGVPAYTKPGHRNGNRTEGDDRDNQHRDWRDLPRGAVRAQPDNSGAVSAAGRPGGAGDAAGFVAVDERVVMR